MKFKKSILLGVTAVSFGTAIASTPINAQAYSTYRTIPRAIRGYYIGNRATAMITAHGFNQGAPQADAYTYKVRSVSRSGHYYRIHCSFDMGGMSYFTMKVHKLSRNKIKVNGMPVLHKVSKSHYYWYANHGITG